MSATSPRLFATDTYTDVTAEFIKECESLPPSGLKEAPNFKLLDVLSAAQVGIPKIDTGANYTTFKEEFENFKIEKSDDGISDFVESLFCSYMAFLDGHSMISTFMSNLQVEQIYKLKTVDLNNKDFVYAACLGLLKAVQVTCTYASNGALYPEEDMHFSQLDFSHVEDCEVQQVVELLDSAGKLARQQNFNQVSLALERWSSWLTVLRQGIKKIGTAQKLINLPWNKPADKSYPQFQFTGVQSRFNYICFKEPTVVYTIEQAQNSLTEILNSILDISSVLKVVRSTDLSGVLLQFCSKRRPAIVRSMVNQCMQDNTIFGKTSISWVKLDIEESCPVTLPSKNPVIDEFLSNASLCYQDLLHIFLTNKCRVREGLNALVLSYDSLQVQATEIDLALSTKTLSNWVLLRKLQAMLWVILLSFDLELIQYNEIAATYFVAHQICQAMLTHLGLMRSLFETTNMRADAGHAYLASLILETEMISQLCSAEYMLFFALYKQHPPKPNVLTKDLYNLRFQGFSTIGVPKVPEFESYIELMNGFELETALQGAGSHSMTVRNLVSDLQKMVANNEDLPNLKKSAFGISIAVSQIVKNEGKISGVEIDLNSGHRYFVAPKISFFK